MSNYNSSLLRFFENGFILLGGKPILGLKDVKLSYKNNTTEIKNFDQNRIKNFYIQNSEWTASCSGDFLPTTATTKSLLSWGATGDSRIVAASSATNGALLLEAAKGTSALTFAGKLSEGVYETGSVLITTCEINTSAGENLQYSIELQGVSPLVLQPS
jgi:hypothetical protein